MKENENTVSTVEKINYQFTPIPTNLIYVLDSDLIKLLTLFISEESYWRNKNRLNNGYFFKSIEEIQAVMFIKNKQDVRILIETLYINNFIDVVMNGNSHNANEFKINWDKVLEYNEKSITDIIKFDEPILKFKRGTKCTYTSNTKVSTNCSTKVSTKCTPTINNTDNLNNIEDINNKKEKDINIQKEKVEEIETDIPINFENKKEENEENEEVMKAEIIKINNSIGYKSDESNLTNNNESNNPIEVNVNNTNKALIKPITEDNINIEDNVSPTKKSLTETFKITIPSDSEMELLKKENSYIYQLVKYYQEGEYSKEEVIEIINSYKRNYSKPFELIKKHLSPIIGDSSNKGVIAPITEDKTSTEESLLPIKEMLTESLKTANSSIINDEDINVLEQVLNNYFNSPVDSVYNQGSSRLNKISNGNNSKFLSLKSIFDMVVEEMDNKKYRQTNKLPTELTMSEYYKYKGIDDKLVEIW